jgi:hypothetical protein
MKSHFFNNSPNCNIWKAVKIAKKTNDIPANLTYNNANVNYENSANAFASYFHEKIKKICFHQG